MIGDYAPPAGDSGRGVDTDVAINLACQIRAVMNADRDEFLIAAAAYLLNSQCDQDELIAAWEHLNAGERRAWREFVRMGRC